mmetsp:Transcript_8543/g.13086  ORF Transcript_8543/g.13086 Transcript_8543/m.13086 type:complete len:210 (+) Transcript_8543:51-680(+)
MIHVDARIFMLSGVNLRVHKTLMALPNTTILALFLFSLFHRAIKTSGAWHLVPCFLRGGILQTWHEPPIPPFSPKPRCPSPSAGTPRPHPDRFGGRFAPSRRTAHSGLQCTLQCHRSAGRGWARLRSPPGPPWSTGPGTPPRSSRCGRPSPGASPPRSGGARARSYPSPPPPPLRCSPSLRSPWSRPRVRWGPWAGPPVGPAGAGWSSR